MVRFIKEAYCVALLSLAFPLHVWVTNANTFSASVIFYPALVIFVVNLLLFLGFKRLMRCAKAPLVLLIVLNLMFFLLGDVFSVGQTRLHAWLRAQALPSSPATIYGVLFCALLMLIYLAYRMGRFINRQPNGNLFIVVFLHLVMASLLVDGIRHDAFSDIASKPRLRVTPQDMPDMPAALVQLPQSPTRPDIYYIILDGYGRADVLAEWYQYDNTAFLHYLRQKGFYIADQARSNYAQTALSLTSSLNFDYLSDIMTLDAQDYNRGPLQAMLLNNRLMRVLKQQGYAVYAFASGYIYTEFYNADRYIHDKNLVQQLPRQFLSHLLAASALQILDTKLHKTRLLEWMDRLPGLNTIRADEDLHRRRVEMTLDYLKRPSFGDTPPRFVFIHILCPHPPYVFERALAPQERLVNPEREKWMAGLLPDQRQAMLRYREQVAYINDQITAVINNLMSDSRPKLILLQGDHGPPLRWHGMEDDVRTGMPILNAYYFSDGRYEKLSPGITPVNSFRIILDQYMGARLPLLPDRSYFSPWAAPYQFKDVTDIVK